MRKRIKTKRMRKAGNTSSSWLPLDTRIFPDIISFGHVKGFSRIFLIIEISLVTFVLIISLLLACCKLFLFI